MKKPSVTWHAGAMDTEPNTLESIQAAINSNAEIIEIDVTFRPCGTPVIIHSSAPAENEGVLFEDAIKLLAKGSCKVNLDLKSTANLPAVDEIINKHEMMSRVFYTGVFETWVEKIKNNSAIPCYLNYSVSRKESKKEDAAQAVADKAKALGVIGINANFRGVKKQFSDVMHKNGLEVSLWTANKKREMKKVIKANPDNITTKRPDLLNSILNK